MPVNTAAIAQQIPRQRESATPAHGTTAGNAPGAAWPDAPPKSPTAPQSVPVSTPASPSALPVHAPCPAANRLAADIHAMLIETQGAATGPANPGTATAPTSAEKKLAADIQDLMSRMGHGQEPSKSLGRQSGMAGGAHGHRHGGFAGHTGHGGQPHSASSVETAAAAAGGGGGTGRAVPAVLAGDIARAIRAYAGATPAQATT